MTTYAVTDPLLQARDLRVEITADGAKFFPVDGVSLALAPGECLGIVGESGSGKTLTLKALLGLLPADARLAGGEILFESRGSLSPVDPVQLRGSGIAMVFQEPSTALNPLMRAGQLIIDAYRATHRASRKDAESAALRLMKEVGIPAPTERLRAYPHELSGGLRQRVMIAMALATEPRVLLCDEPTTALDVTVQQQILTLLHRVGEERGLALIYVTHDLAVVRNICDRIAVMYAGRIVETGRVDEVFSAPAHPYTQGLLRSVPTIEMTAERLVSIPGTPPDPRAFPDGCRFHPRCPLCRPDCREASYELQQISPHRETACIHHRDMTKPSEIGVA